MFELSFRQIFGGQPMKSTITKSKKFRSIIQQADLKSRIPSAVLYMGKVKLEVDVSNKFRVACRKVTATETLTANDVLNVEKKCKI